MVVAGHISLVTARVNDIGIIRADCNVAALAAADLVVVGDRDRSKRRAAGKRNGRVILLRAVDAVGHLIVGDHVIEFACGLVIDRRPALGTVEGHAGTTIMTADHALRIAGIDPEIVIVAMWNGNLREGRSAINRLVAALVEYPERIGVLGIGIDVLVVPGTLAQVLFV